MEANDLEMICIKLYQLDALENAVGKFTLNLGDKVQRPITQIVDIDRA